MFANNFGTYQNVECGLVYLIPHPPGHTFSFNPRATSSTSVFSPIPLVAIDVKASVVHAVAQVEITQVYVNREAQPIEAIYYFPVDSNGAVTHFHAELKGRTINGVVKPAEEAKAQYEKAVQERKSAFLGEANKPDIFKVRVGYLKPGAQVKVVIGYVTEVKNEKEKDCSALRFFIPTTVSPRYIPPTETDQKSLDLGNMTFSAIAPAPLTINVTVAIQGAFKSVESPSHQVNISQGPVPDKPTWTRAVINLTGKSTDMDRDFVVNITPQEVHVPRLYKETMEGSTVMMAHLIPSFNLDEQKVELIFVLDRSGSMQGQSIAVAKKALMLFLHSMPADCYFNVVGFGSSFQFLFPESMKYGDWSLKTALVLAERLNADLGGTEIMAPLQEVFNRKPIDGYLRQLFVITDGQVSNTDQVIGLISAKADSSRVFALGIGAGASHDLVERMASAGGGTAAFATYDENIDSKVLHQLKNAIQPSLTDVNISWDGVANIPTTAAPIPVEVNREKTLLGYGKPVNSPAEAESPAPVTLPRQVPEKVPPIFDGSQLLVFGIFDAHLPTGVCITAQSPDGPLSIKIKFDESSETELDSTGMLHSLAAIKAINDLQLKILRSEAEKRPYGTYNDANDTIKALKTQIVKISCKFGVVSKYTSFVAVDTNSQASDENWAMQTRYVPSQLPHGWSGFSGRPNPNLTQLLSHQICHTPQQQQPQQARQVPFQFGFQQQNQVLQPHMNVSNVCSSGAASNQFSPSPVPFQSSSFSSTFGSPMSARSKKQSERTSSESEPSVFGSVAISGTYEPASKRSLFSAGSHISALSAIPSSSMPFSVDSSNTGTNSIGNHSLSSFFDMASGVPFGAMQSSLSAPGPTCQASVDKEVPRTEEDRLHLLIKLQSFDGSFPLNESFCTSIRLSLKKLRSHAHSNDWDEKSYATAVALCYFAEKFAGFKDSWELVALKARKWLQKNASLCMDAMINSATQYIQSTN